jgi:hypothetical protein
MSYDDTTGISMTDLANFLSNPPRFMRNNHVRYCGQSPPRGGESYEFALLRIGAAGARKQRVFLGLSLGKADAGVFEIRLASGGNVAGKGEHLGTFRAVWSGYQAGGTARCALVGWGEDIMLTPELTGCSVVCAPQPNGGAYFSHYNLRDPANNARKMDVAGMEAQALTDYPSNTHGVLSKETYYAKAKAGAPGAKFARATVIGWRTGGEWTFWTQYVEEKSGAFQKRDVQQLRPGTRFG